MQPSEKRDESPGKFPYDDIERNDPTRFIPTAESHTIESLEPTQGSDNLNAIQSPVFTNEGQIFHDYGNREFSELSEEIQSTLEFYEVFGTGPLWTNKLLENTPVEEIPLRIAGNLLAIIPEHCSPMSASSMSVSDLCPYLTDPLIPISEGAVSDIFRVLEGIMGFYLLVNSMLRLVVYDDSDIGHALSHYPHEFSGTRVSSISQSVIPISQRQEEGMSSISQGQYSLIMLCEITRPGNDVNRPRSSTQPSTQLQTANEASTNYAPSLKL
jgi:hypothetical protein